MTRRALLAAALLAGLTACSGTEKQDEAQPRQRTGTLLDGRKHSWVVVGGDSSLAWPAVLQEMLDQHANGERLYTVRNASRPGTSLAEWADADTRFAATAPASAPVDPRGEAPAVSGALCMLESRALAEDEAAYLDRDAVAGVERAAAAWNDLAAILAENGAARLLVATPLHRADLHPVESDVIHRATRPDQSRLLIGPDLWQTSTGMQSVLLTPRGRLTERGTLFVAIAWYRHLAGADVRMDVIQRMRLNPLDVEELERNHLKTLVAGR